MRNTLIYIIIILVVQPLRMQAQTAFSQVYTIDENDESLQASVLHSDPQGFIWVGTKGGLYRFNGRQFINMLPDSLRSGISITAITTDSAGGLWIGTAQGQIASYQAGQWQMFSPDEGLPKKPITGILFDQRRRLWFSAVDEGLYVFEGNRLTNIDVDDGLPDNYVYTLEAMPDGRVLAGTDHGLARISFEKGVKRMDAYSSRDGLPDNIVRAIHPSSQPGQYWIGMEDGGIFRFDAMEHRDAGFRLPGPWTFGRVNDLLPVGNRLWVATEDSGLVDINLAGKETITRKDLLPGLYKTGKLMVDVSGQLWCTSAGRLVRTTLLQLGFIDSIGKEKLTGLHALHITRANSAWISQGKGIEKLERQNGEWTITGRYQFPGIALENITALYQDFQGILWIGTIGAGILRMDAATGRFLQLRGNPETENSHILSIAGKDREVWVSGLNGITRYSLFEGYSLNNSPVYTNFRKRSGIGSDYVYQVFIDSRNRVWFCTDGAGLACLDGGRVYSFADSAGLKSSVVYGMAEGPEGTLWLNTLEQGIVRYDGKAFSRFFTVPGSQGGSVSSISSDGKKLIIMHKRGLELVDIQTGQSRHYGRNNGISRPQVNLNVMAMDTLGVTWIGVEPGIVQVIPETAVPRQVPVTLITGLLVYGREVWPLDNNRFAWDDNNITIRFEGLHYTDPEQVRFQYKLEGYHKDWITSSDHEVNFPRLLHGNYRFRVRTAIDGRFALGEEKNIQFYIKLPFWKTWWFIAGSAAIAILLISLLMQQRFRQLQKWQQLKQDKIQAELQTLRAQVNPHFLFNSFNTLMGVLEENPAQAMAYTGKLSAFYRQMLTYREKNLIPLDEELKILDTYIYLQQQRFGDGLAYENDVPAEARKKFMTPPMTLQLLAENAIKHNTVSADQPLRIRVAVEGDTLRVENTIHRKKKPETGEGVGLRNITDRYSLFTDRKVVLADDGKFFTVLLPLINQILHAHPDR